MPERTSYEPGTPSWVDLGSSDPDAAKRFYGGVFGWEAEDAGDPEQTGGYAFFTNGGRRVAGVGPLMGEGQQAAWSTYVATDDADGVAARAEAAGATILFGPDDIFDSGRMVFFAHPAAGFLGAWQPNQHKGADLVNEPDSLTWNELHTRDLPGAKAFGESVFGWTCGDVDFAGMSYTIVNVGEDGVAGMTGMPPGIPDEVPAHWLTVFAVADCDAAVAAVQEHGGGVTMPPMDMEGVGRFAVVSDPEGVQFGVMKNAPRP